jgi:hypothetical protein
LVLTLNIRGFRNQNVSLYTSGTFFAHLLPMQYKYKILAGLAAAVVLGLILLGREMGVHSINPGLKPGAMNGLVLSALG